MKRQHKERYLSLKSSNKDGDSFSILRMSSVLNLGSGEENNGLLYYLCYCSSFVASECYNMENIWESFGLHEKKNGSPNDVKGFRQQGALVWQQKGSFLMQRWDLHWFWVQDGKKKKIQSMSNSFLSSLCSASFLMHLSQDFGQLLHKQLEFSPPPSPDPHIFCTETWW